MRADNWCNPAFAPGDRFGAFGRGVGKATFGGHNTPAFDAQANNKSGNRPHAEAQRARGLSLIMRL